MAEAGILFPPMGPSIPCRSGSDGTLYWAGANGFGTIITDDQGFHHVESLSPPEVKEVFVSLIVKDNLYFLSSEGLYFYDDAMKDPVIIPSSNLTGAFTGLFEIYGSLYLTSEQEALLKVEGNNLVRTSLGFSVSDEILFVTPGDNHYLIGLNDSRIFFLWQ